MTLLTNLRNPSRNFSLIFLMILSPQNLLCFLSDISSFFFFVVSFSPSTSNLYLFFFLFFFLLFLPRSTWTSLSDSIFSMLFSTNIFCSSSFIILGVNFGDINSFILAKVKYSGGIYLLLFWSLSFFSPCLLIFSKI